MKFSEALANYLGASSYLDWQNSKSTTSKTAVEDAEEDLERAAEVLDQFFVKDPHVTD